MTLDEVLLRKLAEWRFDNDRRTVTPLNDFTDPRGRSVGSSSGETGLANCSTHHDSTAARSGPLSLRPVPLLVWRPASVATRSAISLCRGIAAAAAAAAMAQAGASCSH